VKIVTRFCPGAFPEVARGWRDERRSFRESAVNYDPQTRVQCSPGRRMSWPACEVALPRDFHTRPRDQQEKVVPDRKFFFDTHSFRSIAFHSILKYIPFHTENIYAMRKTNAMFEEKFIGFHILGFFIFYNVKSI